MVRRIVVAGLVLASALLSTRAGGGAAPITLTVLADAPLTISGPSPFASCSTPGADVLYSNAETSPSIAVNPATVGSNRVNLIAAWEQDHWQAINARGLGASYSVDGGKTWARSNIPIGQCATESFAYDRVEQPWVSVGPDGTAYLTAAGTKSDGNAIWATTSRDGGKTWSTVVTVTENAASTKLFSDEPKVTADPAREGTAYLTWNQNLLTDDGPITTWFSKTTDAGKTWSKPTVLVDEKNWYSAIGTPLLVDAHASTLYQAFLQLTPGTVPKKTCKTVMKKGKKKKVCATKHVIPSNPMLKHSLKLTRSADGGQTWSSPSTIRQLVDASTDLPHIAGALTWASATDVKSGKLYVAFADGSLSGGRNKDLSLVSSSDGGTTWSNPTRLNSVATAPASEPTLAINSSGVVGVLYYDFRNSAGGGRLAVDAWFTSSSDGGVHFGHEQHLGGPYDLAAAPVIATSPYIGSYQGLTPVGSSFQTAFVAVNANDRKNPTDILTETISP